MSVTPVLTMSAMWYMFSLYIVKLSRQSECCWGHSNHVVTYARKNLRIGATAGDSCAFDSHVKRKPYSNDELIGSLFYGAHYLRLEA